MIKEKTVNILGLGYIGLPLAGVLADAGYHVNGTDVNPNIISMLQNGCSHIEDEPGLVDLIANVSALGNLQVSLTPKPSDIYVIAVPTPIKADREADLTYVDKAFESIAEILKEGDLVIIESTSPVGTTRMLNSRLLTLRPDLYDTSHRDTNLNSRIHFAYCPERILPGNMIAELRYNNRTVGGLTAECGLLAQEFYRSFVAAEVMLATSPEVAEMVKLTENSFRDLNIAFANELSFICDDVDISVHELITLANEHPRVNILQPGCGVGGHCIAVDPWFLVKGFPNKTNLIKQARLVNDLKPQIVYEKIISAVEEIRRNNKKDVIRIAVLGLTFKPNVADMRESPALQILSDLIQIMNVEIVAIEPNISLLPNSLVCKNIELKTSISKNSNLDEYDVICALVGHKQFESIPRNSKSVYVDPIGLFLSEDL